jgi:Ala-tRNA(Pro) deacylase
LRHTKTVIVQEGREYYLIVLPSSHHVKPEKHAQVIGHPVRLAAEAESATLFPDCELGAMPPLGELYLLPVYWLALRAAPSPLKASCFN